MLRISTENIGDMVVIECEGKISHNDAFALRDTVLAQDIVHVLVLDLSEVNAVEGAGLDIMVSLQYWAQRHNIQFKVFNPSYSVRYRLEQARSMHAFEIASLPEVMGLLMQAQNQASLQANNTMPMAA